MKEILQKIIKVLRIIFGYGILLSLLAGGLTFFGYMAALVIGGEIAAAICAFIYGQIIPVIIKTSTIMVLLGIVIMYLGGEVALTSNKKKAIKNKAEM